MELKDVLDHLRELRSKLYVQGSITLEEIYSLVIACDLVENELKKEEEK